MSARGMGDKGGGGRASMAEDASIRWTVWRNDSTDRKATLMHASECTMEEREDAARTSLHEMKSSYRYLGFAIRAALLLACMRIDRMGDSEV